MKKSPSTPHAKIKGKANIEQVMARLMAQNPDPKGELYWTNPYTLLVAVTLSAQATDVGVNKATKTLFPDVDTPEKMLQLGEERLREKIKTIGLYRNKARFVIEMAEILVREYDGHVPSTLEKLTLLPGVGRKTANVVLNIAFGEPRIAVDTHVYRISHRLGFSNGKTPTKVEEDLMQCIPEKYLQHAHHWLILHGRYVCKKQAPKCDHCVLRDLCPSVFF